MIMTHETLMTFTRLFREVRFACVREEPINDEPFATALPLLDGEETRAAAWLRYCCETLRELVRAESPAVYDFTDAVHNAATLEGLTDGELWFPQRYWDVEIQRFRDQYGQAYFEGFVRDMHSDELVNAHRIKLHLRLSPAWQRDIPRRQ